MTRCAVLLRGVNVGGRNRIAMAAFRQLLQDLGCADVRTYLQSGNAVVDVHPGDLDDLAGQVESAIRDRFDLDVRVLMRTGAELAAVVAANPFPDLVDSPKLLHAAFLERQPDPEQVQALGSRHGEDELRVGDCVLYLAYRGGTSQHSSLEAPLRRLAGVATARNWTTVTTLADLTRPVER